MLREPFRPISVDAMAKTTTQARLKSLAKEPKVVRGNNSGSFSFGLRRYASKGPRRLFRLQERLLCPVFEPEAEQPRKILHLHVTGTTG